MKLSATTFLLMICATVNASPLSLTPGVAKNLQRMVERGDARAVAVGLYRNGETEFFAFGQLSRNDTGAPVRSTLFEIGSISKVFTALLTQTLIEKNRLDWDAPISRYLADTVFTSEAVAAITLRELATHTSGLPRVPDNMDPPDPLDPYAGYDRDDLIAFLSRYDPDPDEIVKQYDYSNLGAGLLGMIAADAARQSFPDATKEHVLQPLEMGDTSVGLPEDNRDRLAAGFSLGADMPNWAGFDALAGAGAMVSTTGDMLRFIHHNYRMTTLGSALGNIREPQAGGETGLGWHIRDTDDGDSVIWHNGGTGGYASFLAIRPKEKTGVVILTASTEYMRVTDIGFSQITGRSAEPVTADFDRYTGTYKIADGFVLTVFADDDLLMAQATGQAAFPLTQTGEDQFTFEPAGIRIVFEGDASKAAEKLTLHQAGQTTPAPRVADDQGIRRREEIPIDASALADFAGRYQLGADAIFTVEARGGQLFAQLTGQAAFPVFLYETDNFFYKVVDAQLHFERDADGKVIAVVLHQGGEQRAPRIE